MKVSTKTSIKSRLPHPLWKALVSSYRCLMWGKYSIKMKLSPRSLKYYCPCCKIRTAELVQGDYLGHPDFYDLGLFTGFEQNVVCPVCGSLPRHRILASWCDKNKDLFVSSKVLYFAPERCMMRWFKNNNVKPDTADLYSPDAELKLDIQDTGLPDESYDVIICNHVLEHVDDYMKALREMRRILKPDGMLICSFPVSLDVDTVDEDPDAVSEEQRLHRYGQSDHVRLFGRKSDELIKSAGYDVSVIKGEDYPKNIAPVVGPGAYDINILFVCKKV